MLVELDIQNFAIIKSLKIKFQPQMTVLIGETGAGKSILIDALSLLLGHRAQKEMVRSGQSKAVVTGLFTLQDEEMREVEQIADDYGLPMDGDDLIISREISSKGRNVIRINGQLTTITALAKIGEYLVDIHGQNDQQMLMDQSRQIDLVDEYAGKDFKPLLCKYQAEYQTWQRLNQRLEHLRRDSRELAQRQDILQFQVEELTQADLTDEQEDQNLEDEFNKLNNYQKIAESANFMIQLFDDDEHGLTSLLGDAQGTAEDLADLDKDFKNVAQSITDGVYSLSDARSELGDIMDSLEFDEERYQYVQNRLDLLNNLKKKYGPSLADVFDFYAKVSKELSQFETGGLDEEELVKQIAAVEEKMSVMAADLHQARESTALKLEEAIKHELADLYMDKARFSIRFAKTDNFTVKGTDDLAFYIAPNPGEELMPLVKIVSGGEQSRLILALKAIFSRVEPVGTMVFDEIDTGVSGRVAAAIGKKMHAIAGQKQVIAITHSPQVAASADHRFAIAKQVAAGETFTQVKELDEDSSIKMIAQMMAGANVSEAAEQNAADLIASQRKQD
ncbi:DNA repair protein RecN [Lactobacillus delbrueckii subsp. lactis]|jgi:DNA repair protein RecN (Recombination protein N)|uniref:DNA repair protein RecN n=1 Tax=Lactobacillus delbrueckii TaxID=1584 RepID=A0ABD4W0J9_9LACO|nr:DNA repair protein RecN [Lactobacillus delbrueckii]ADQ61382.1 RecN, ATPase involved in DNA repair [Lactobacillus delbrueckii subsp. bulgaricus ND02]MBN6089340.1 DNA repair protein RecN [Lactobacillus delbrueckii subsp. bulgaricus]MBO3081285.1 DNA repair protein RecN [Lactobacillus delbrueckii subsp. bulgaricus]MCD5437488.1 DNA repair protein RecN [Lactobacillus delbrueckii subsp. lactis]MCD5439724.1 DNA repair protein RecN [Lactobacillus delbrueckii subsp. lactis]